MKSFSYLFKKYRLRAEFETIASFSSALAKEGYFYEESTFFHWQKGSRIPSDRTLVITLIKIFIQRKAIRSQEEANELLAATGLGYLTKDEEKKLGLQIENNNILNKTHIHFSLLAVYVLSGVLLIVSVLYITSIFYSRNYVNFPAMVPSENTEPKKMVIGIDATLPPMEYIQNNQMVGFDVDLGNDLAKELHTGIEFRNINFDNVFNALDQRQINMIISAVTITKERQQKYNFSDEYLNVGQVIITRKDNTTIHGVKDLKAKKIATQAGTTNEQEALKYTSDDLIFRYPDFEQAADALVAGKVDAIFTDLPNAGGIISHHPNLKIAGEPFTKEYYGIVFIKGDSSVIEINKALSNLRKKGVLTELEKKWLHKYD
jgi:polar amino acid transport system substrate-binding protein